MTPKEKVRVHVQIERENKRKLKEWKEIEELNKRIAEEELQKLVEAGIVA